MVLCFVFLELRVFLCVGNVFTFCKMCHVYLYSLVLFIKKHNFSLPEIFCYYIFNICNLKELQLMSIMNSNEESMLARDHELQRIWSRRSSSGPQGFLS